MAWMIKGASIATLNDEDQRFENGDIVIDKGEIVALGQNLSPEYFRVEEILQARDKLAIPGLINAHLHSHDRFDKGRFDNYPLEVWMALYNPPLGRRNWTARECYLRTLLNAIEMLKTGTTTVIDDVAHGPAPSEENVEAVFQAYHDVGMRALVSIQYSDKPYYQTVPYFEELLPETLKTEIRQLSNLASDDLLKLWRTCARRWQDRVKFALSPSAPHRCTDDFLVKTRQLSEELDLPIIIHFLETKVQVVTSRILYGRSLADHICSLGLLSPKTILIHGVWVTGHELRVVKETGASIVHSPISNLKLGSGIAPVRNMLDAGINVALGTDNNNANDSANIFEAMKMAALLHKVGNHNYEQWVGAQDVLRMATRGGARCAGLHNKIGSLSVGMKADIVLLDLNQPSFYPHNNLLHQLVFCEHGEAVDTVIVDGKILLKGKEMTTINENAIFEELKVREDEIREKIRWASARGWELEPYMRQAYFKCVGQQIEGMKAESPNQT